MAILNQEHLLVLELSSFGSDASGYTTEQFADVQLRSPSGVASTLEPLTQFTVEELGDGAYALTLASGTLNELGTWLLTLQGTEEAPFDRVRGAIDVAVAPDTQLALWASGVNTFAVAVAYDGDGRVLTWVVYCFDTEEDTATYANTYALMGAAVPVDVAALVRAQLLKTFTYSAEGRLRTTATRVLS